MEASRLRIIGIEMFGIDLFSRASASAMVGQDCGGDLIYADMFSAPDAQTAVLAIAVIDRLIQSRNNGDDVPLDCNNVSNCQQKFSEFSFDDIASVSNCRDEEPSSFIIAHFDSPASYRGGGLYIILNGDLDSTDAPISVRFGENQPLPPV